MAGMPKRRAKRNNPRAGLIYAMAPPPRRGRHLSFGGGPAEWHSPGFGQPRQYVRDGWKFTTEPLGKGAERWHVFVKHTNVWNRAAPRFVGAARTLGEALDLAEGYEL